MHTTVCSQVNTHMGKTAFNYLVIYIRWIVYRLSGFFIQNQCRQRTQFNELINHHQKSLELNLII